MKSVDRKIIELQQTTIERLAEEIGGNAPFIVSDLRTSVKALLDEDTLLKLSGQGNVKTTNHLTLHPYAERVSEADIVILLKEFVSVDNTGYDEGGLWVIGSHLQVPLPKNVEDLQPGCYWTKHNTVVVLRFDQGADTHHLHIALSRVEDELPTFAITTHLKKTRETLTHQHFDVLNKNKLRTQLIQTLKKYGLSVPMYVSEGTIVGTLKESNQYDTPFTVFPYELTLSKGGGLTVRHEDGVPVTWESLNTTKQNQFLERVTG